jgi:ATP-dependent Lon protease
MPKEALDKANAELKKLKLMSPMSAEATVVRNYIDTLVSLPWKKKSKVNNDLSNAEKVLEGDHYGLEKVKERILEYPVQQRVDKLKAPILCLVGPPGVGKTSLGQSIARATNRKFVRMAWAACDEAEIRGHRRTYIGSMPGKVLQSWPRSACATRCSCSTRSTRWARTSVAILVGAAGSARSGTEPHVLDHYIEVDFDLSDVMFVATSNSSTSRRPAGPHGSDPPVRLHRRRENQHRPALPAAEADQEQRSEGGRDLGGRSALRDIIRYYTREAGVRSLSAKCRRSAARW